MGKRVVDDESLTSVADVIRSKSGTSGGMVFPAGFVSAVEAIQAGSSGGVTAGAPTPEGNLMSNMLYAITSGIAAHGEFTLASALPNSETLIIDTGLEKIRGMLYVNVGWDGTLESGKGRAAWGAMLMDPETELTEWIYNTQSPFSFNWSVRMDGTASGSAFMVYVNSIRFDGGSMYATAQYNGNANYTPFAPGMKYQWFAW